MNALDQFNWLNDDEKAELKELVENGTQQVLKQAKERAKEGMAGKDFEQQETIRLFNELVKEYTQITSDALLNKVSELALAPFVDSETAKEEAITLDFKGYPEKSMFHTTLLSRDLPLLMKKNKEDANQFFVKRRRNSRDIIGTLTFEDIVEQHKNIEPLDMVHYMGVCRLYDNGTRTFTPDMLVRATYSDNKKTVTEKQRKEAMQSVDKLMRTVIDIDVSEEYRAYRKIGKNEQLFLGENMLYARRAKLKHSNGSVSWGYELLQQPVLDVHAFNLGHIDRLDNELVEASGGKEDLLLTYYLSSRLATLLNKNNNMSNVVLLDTVYKHIEIEEPSRQKAAQIRKKIEGRLTEWKNKKTIKSFEFIKEGNKITKFKIIV